MQTWLLCLIALLPAVGLCDGPQVLAPGYSPLSYAPPAPGSYALPAVGQAGDGQVLDTGGRPHSLHALFADRIVILSFIYSVSFLHADTVLNDVRTLLLEEQARVVQVSTRAEDHKEGYERGDGQTRSRSLAARTGEEADLVALFRAPPLGLPEVPVPANNPVTPRKVALGRRLFYDRRLSLNDTFSCAMCHIPEQGFTSNELATVVGIEGRTVRRNSPTLYNVAYAERLFHDGRENRLEQQVWAPLLARNEMGNPSIGSVIDKIQAMPDYAGLFEAAFDGRGPTMETVGMAIASYERTLVSGNSPFDRWRYGGEAAVLSDSARRGFALFTGKAGCSACHRIGGDSAPFTDNRLHNTGIGYRASMQALPERRRVRVAPGVYVEVDPELIDSVAEPPPGDLGLYELTQDPADRWRYKTPTLRNVALTAPYMHDGSLSTLREVVEFYNRGGVSNELLDPLLRPLELSEQAVEDLAAFLRSLTGDNVDLLVSDAFAAPVGDLTRADPTGRTGTGRRIDPCAGRPGSRVLLGLLSSTAVHCLHCPLGGGCEAAGTQASLEARGLEPCHGPRGNSKGGVTRRSSFR